MQMSIATNGLQSSEADLRCLFFSYPVQALQVRDIQVLPIMGLLLLQMTQKDVP